MRKGVLGLAILVFLLMATPAMAFEKVNITQTTADIAFQKDYGAVTQGNTLTIDLNLTFTLESLNTSASNITVTASSATASTTVDLTVNGVLVANDAVITGGSSQTWDFPAFASAGVNMNAKYLTIKVTAVANDTSADVLNLNCDNKPVVANFSFSVSEVKLSDPEVKYYDTDSFYSVKQTITISQNSDVNISDVNCTFSYPSNQITKGDLYKNYGVLNKTQSKSHVVYFQKRGPYVTELKSTVNTNYVTKIKIYSPENLTAKLKFDPTEKPWAKYFPKFSKDKLKSMKLDDETIDWEDPSGLVITEDMSLSKGYNILNITYSKPPVAVPYAVPMVTPLPWEQTILDVPVWMWITGLIIIGCSAVYYYVVGRR